MVVRRISAHGPEAFVIDPNAETALGVQIGKRHARFGDAPNPNLLIQAATTTAPDRPA